MQKYPLSEIINSSQYYRTKPDSYVMQKWIKAAIKRLQLRHRSTIIRSIIISIIIVWLAIVWRWMYQQWMLTSLLWDENHTPTNSLSNTQSWNTRKDAYIRQIEDVFVRQ